MTKAEYIEKWGLMFLYHPDPEFMGMDLYDFAYYAAHVTDDPELAELAKTCVISTEDFQFYLEEQINDARRNSCNAE